MKYCYQCDAQVTYLFGDGRCGRCTRLTPEEVRGEHLENEMRKSNDNTVELEGVLERETEKAYLVDFGLADKVWMHKSQVRDVQKGSGRTTAFTVTEWIANEKGLI